MLIGLVALVVGFLAGWVVGVCDGVDHAHGKHRKAPTTAVSHFTPYN